MLLIKRARVLKQARHKVPMAVDILTSEYQPGDRWLVYCDDVAQLHAVIDGCLEAGLPTLAFYSGMPSDRDTVIRSLAEYGGIVVAIRCLDEGIDIPVTDHALILASSSVEREYIQRRGRVLRRAPASGKVSAEVHDLMLVDPIGGALTKSEALRALEFVRLARNPAARDRLKVIVSLSQDPIELPDLLDEEEGND
jgi:superfamily II DNA or RNA helicase